MGISKNLHLELDGASPEDRRVVLFALAYEKARKEIQWGYSVFGRDTRINKEIFNTRQFKVCRTVVRWLDKEGWKVAWNEINWKAYIRFCFKHLYPTIPFPGQLKNKLLLKKYTLSAPDKEVKDKRSSEQMEQIYRRVLDPVFSNTAVLVTLGLRANQEF